MPNASTPPDRLALTVEEAAESIHVSRAWLYSRVAAGDIPSVKLGAKNRRILVSDLEAFVRRYRQNGQDAAA